MRVFFWEAGEGGSCYYRCALPAMALRWIEHETARSPDIRTQPWGTDGPDVLVASRIAQPGPVTLFERIRLSRDCTTVVDLDDDYLHIDRESNPQAFAFWDRDMRDRLLKAVSLAHRVTVASEGLAEVMREHHDDVRVVPNGLHAAWMSAPRTYGGDGPVRIGWSGTSSTVHELPLVARALNRILDYRGAYPVEVVTVGIPRQWVSWAGLDPDRVRVIDMIPNTDRYLVACHEHFDVWVAPYRDIPFNRAKFATKALEASFLGIPIVASSIPPYEAAVEHGVTGFLVRQSHEWGRYIRRLVDDPELRRSMGLAARARASASIMQGLALDWVDALTLTPQPVGAARSTGI